MSAYYDKKLAADAVRKLLESLDAKKDARRSKAEAAVYKIRGGGEAMIEAAGRDYRVRLYHGKCPC